MKRTVKEIICYTRRLRLPSKEKQEAGREQMDLLRQSMPETEFASWMKRVRYHEAAHAVLEDAE
jgi:hypothetical protein